MRPAAMGLVRRLAIGARTPWPWPKCYIVTKRRPHAHATSMTIITTIITRRGASAGVGVAVDPAIVRGRAARGCGGGDRADLGGGVLGHASSEPTSRSMTAALRFHNLTLGYDRHPAVHHLDGAVETGALMAVVGPNGAGKSTLFKGIVGVIKPLAGRIERGGLAARDIAYLPQAAEIDRTFPINVYDMVAMGLWHRTGLFGGIDRKGATPRRGGDRRGRPDRLRGARHRHAVGRPDAAHAVRAPAAAGRARDRARRAVQRGRRQDLGRPVRPGAALARREAHRAHGAARHRFRAREFPRDAAARPRAGGLGQHGDGADAGEPADGARACARPSTSTPRSAPCRPPQPDRIATCTTRSFGPVRRVRVHAPRARRHRRARARRRPDRRVPDAAPHEPGRRRHGARDPAGRGDRLPGLGPQPVRHDRGRPDRRLRGRAAHRHRRAHHRAEGGRGARRPSTCSRSRSASPSCR